MFRPRSTPYPPGVAPSRAWKIPSPRIPYDRRHRCLQSHAPIQRERRLADVSDRRQELHRSVDLLLWQFDTFQGAGVEGIVSGEIEMAVPT
jgi:hypothetical protein